MADSRQPGPMCQSNRPVDVDDGTMCRMPSSSPRPVGSSGATLGGPITVTSEDVKAAVDSVTGNVGQISYDAFIRKYVYEPAAEAIGKQGEEFVRKGILSKAKAAEWVNAQRNTLLVNVRDQKNSPLGRAISEYLKPREKLPSVGDLTKKYAAKMPGASSDDVFEAIIRSGARTRGSVNRVAVVLRWGGPVLLAVNIGLSAHLVAEAPPEQRGRVAAREGGGLVGGTVGGWAGAKGGCAAGAAVGVWFEGVGAAPGCLIGGVIGGLGIGYAGSRVGSWLGEQAFDFTHSVIEWSEAR